MGKSVSQVRSDRWRLGRDPHASAGLAAVRRRAAVTVVAERAIRLPCLQAESRGWIARPRVLAVIAAPAHDRVGAHALTCGTGVRLRA
jgi:hypothetical protein